MKPDCVALLSIRLRSKQVIDPDKVVDRIRVFPDERESEFMGTGTQWNRPIVDSGDGDVRIVEGWPELTSINH